MAAVPEAMAEWLARHAPGLVRVGIETGPLAVWHLHGPRKLGVPVACMDARHAQKVLSYWPMKPDRNDAHERLARRVGPMKAKVAVAPKLAVLLARPWAKGEEFRWQPA